MVHKGEKRVKGLPRSDIVAIVEWFTITILQSYANHPLRLHNTEAAISRHQP
jgi:hypothetical protein